jgi:hypothetical protein
MKFFRRAKALGLIYGFFIPFRSKDEKKFFQGKTLAPQPRTERINTTLGYRHYTEVYMTSEKEATQTKRYYKIEILLRNGERLKMPVSARNIACAKDCVKYWFKDYGERGIKKIGSYYVITEKEFENSCTEYLNKKEG